MDYYDMKLELKDKWREKFDRVKEIQKGDYIGFPLSEITAGYLYDLRVGYGDDVSNYPYSIDPYIDRNMNEDMIVILQYLGDGEFLELITNRIVLCNDGELVPEHEAFNTSRTALEFAEKVEMFKENPIMVSTLVDYAFPLSDELKLLYYNTTLKNQEAVINRLDKLTELSNELLADGFKEMVAEDHEEALKEVEEMAIREKEHPEIVEVDKFIESHGRKI